MIWKSNKKYQYVYALSLEEGRLNLSVLQQREPNKVESNIEPEHYSWRGRSYDLVHSQTVNIDKATEGPADAFDYMSALDGIFDEHSDWALKEQTMIIILNVKVYREAKINRPNDVNDKGFIDSLPFLLGDNNLRTLNIDPTDMIADYYEYSEQVGSERKIEVVAISRLFIQPLLDYLHEKEVNIRSITIDKMVLPYWFDPQEKVFSIRQVGAAGPELKVINERKLVYSRDALRAESLNRLQSFDTEKIGRLAIDIQSSQRYYTHTLGQHGDDVVYYLDADVELGGIRAELQGMLGPQFHSFKFPAWAKNKVSQSQPQSQIPALAAFLWLAETDAEQRGNNKSWLNKLVHALHKPKGKPNTELKKEPEIQSTKLAMLTAAANYGRGQSS